MISNNLDFIGFILLSYMIGSISGSILLGKIWKIDIRNMGSGSAGGTNALREVGKTFALFTVLIDISKGILAIYLVQGMNNSTLTFFCGIAVAIGHILPIFHNFKGGKGAGTLLGVLIYIYPESITYILFAWIITLVFSGYVGLSTIIAAFSLLLYSIISFQELSIVFFSGAIVILIILSHIKNIKRMIDGNENQFEKIMLFRRK